VRHQRWSRARAALYVAAAPLLPWLVLARAGRASQRAGWLRAFLLTLPVQAAGQASWCLGEALAHGQHALRGRGAPTPAALGARS
jgi:hypothetical protein